MKEAPFGAFFLSGSWGSCQLWAPSAPRHLAVRGYLSHALIILPTENKQLNTN